MSGGNQGPEGSVPGVPFAKGHDPRRGHGLPGKAGPKPKKFKALLRRILNDPKAQEAVKAVLNDPENRHYGTVLKTALAYTEGVPKQVVEVDGNMPVLRIERDDG